MQLEICISLQFYIRLDTKSDIIVKIFIKNEICISLQFYIRQDTNHVWYLHIRVGYCSIRRDQQLQHPQRKQGAEFA